jgi:hypothetical protein
MTLGSDVHPQNPPPPVLPDPQKGTPLTELPPREMLPFRSPPTISKNSQSADSLGTPTGPYRDTRLQSFLLHLSLKVPVNEPPPPCSPTGSLWREKLHLQRLWFIHSFISVRIPNKELSHEKGENIWSPSTETHVDGRPTYNGVLPGSPGYLASI